MEVFASNEDAFLPGFEAEAVAHFQEKVLKAIKQRVFEVGLARGVLGAEAEKLEDVGIADDLMRLLVCWSIARQKPLSPVNFVPSATNSLNC